MSRAITRRELLLQGVATAAMGIHCTSSQEPPPKPSTVGSGIPWRSLGKTGVRVSMLAFGCGGSFTKGYSDEGKALEVLNWVFKEGINYFDTAHDYGKGESERRLGVFLADHRKDVFVATKLLARDRERSSDESSSFETLC